MSGTLRLDKWLWQARFFKSRSLASKACQTGNFRVNETRVAKPHYALRPGDVLTFPLHDNIRVIEVVALGARRGPAPEAQALYKDLSPPQAPSHAKGTTDQRAKPALREPGSGRPTKAERRAMDKFIDGSNINDEES